MKVVRLFLLVVALAASEAAFAMNGASALANADNQSEAGGEILDAIYGYRFAYPASWRYIDEHDTGANHVVTFRIDGPVSRQQTFHIVLENLDHRQQTLEDWLSIRESDFSGELVATRPVTLGDALGIERIYGGLEGYSVAWYFLRNQKVYLLNLGPLIALDETSFRLIHSHFDWLEGDYVQLVPELPTSVLVPPAEAPATMPPLRFPFCDSWRISAGYYNDSPGHPNDRTNRYALDWVVSGGSTYLAPIYAANNGNVSTTWDPYGGGNLALVLYDGDTSYKTVYAHLYDYAVTSGYVTAGTRIGRADCTGTACSGDHLHFALWHLEADNQWWSVLPEPMSGATGFRAGQTHQRNCGGCCGCTDQKVEGVMKTLLPRSEPGALYTHLPPQPGLTGIDGSFPASTATPTTLDHVAPDNLVQIDRVTTGSDPSSQSHMDGTDTTPPLFVSTASDDQSPTRDTNPPTFMWLDATDNVNLAGYRVYWGDNPQGTAPNVVQDPQYTPPEPEILNEAATRYLRVAAFDRAGNQSDWQTVAVWRYDPTPPTGTLIIGSGGPGVRTLNVALHVDASDEHSGLSAMRFSRDGDRWNDWEPYATDRWWRLEDVQQLQTIFAEVRDAVGNISNPMTARVTVKLHVPPPTSTDYQLARSVFGMSGGSKTSSDYTMRGTGGQFLATGRMQSAGYEVVPGFWAGIASTPCYDFGGQLGVDVFDISAVASRWGTTSGSPTYDPLYDVNSDGHIDIADVMIVAAAWGTMCG